MKFYEIEGRKKQMKHATDKNKQKEKGGTEWF